MAIVKPPVLPIWADTGDKVQPTDPEIIQGWPLTNVPPSRQRFNWLQNFFSNGIRYFSRRGLPDWDALETYLIGDRIIGDDNNTYRSLANANINFTPSTNPTKWEIWGTTLAQATGRLVGVQVFAASGTYTPTLGTTSIVVEALGGGGGGGGVAAAPAGQAGGGGGGGGGAFGRGRFTSAFSGLAVTIGLGGTGVSAANGNAGGSTSLGSLVIAPGGAGGTLMAPTNVFPAIVGGGTGATVATGGFENFAGHMGGSSLVLSPTQGVSGDGAASHKGGGAYHRGGSTQAGAPATTRGSGASGGFVIAGGAAVAGGAGAPGLLTIFEYS